jgi:hypothetical protein
MFGISILEGGFRRPICAREPNATNDPGLISRNGDESAGGHGSSKHALPGLNLAGRF